MKREELLQAGCHWAEGEKGEILVEHSMIHLPCQVWPLGAFGTESISRYGDGLRGDCVLRRSIGRRKVACIPKFGSIP